MKALSIRQPWPWAIFNLGKNVENRPRRTHLRGRVMIHAGKTYDHEGAKWIRETFAFSTGSGIVLRTSPGAEMDILVPGPDDLPRGGFVGSVEIVDCVEHLDSPWFHGRYGYILKDPIEVAYRDYKGQLGFFNIDSTKGHF